MRHRPVILFYCQHSLGMGHLVRSFALVRALAQDFDVVFLNGGRLPGHTTPPEGIRMVNLPPLGMDTDSQLFSQDPHYTVEEAKAERRREIIACFAHLDPQVIVIESFPFGRKKFADEILPLLDHAHRRLPGRPLLLTSLRDILVGGRRDQQHHDNRAAALVNRYFDGVLVHADPTFARMEESFHVDEPLQVPVHYTGFVAPSRAAVTETRREQRVIVSAGGGMVGEPLFRAALVAQRILWTERQLPMTIVAGPFLPEAAWQALQSSAAGCDGLMLKRSVPDLGAEMRTVTMSISQCGYNTAMDIVSSGVAALVVPYNEGREDEQMNRARRLEQLGVLRVLEPGRLDGQILASELRRLAGFRPNPAGLDLNGAANTTMLIKNLLGTSPHNRGVPAPARQERVAPR